MRAPGPLALVVLSGTRFRREVATRHRCASVNTSERAQQSNPDYLARLRLKDAQIHHTPEGTIGLMSLSATVACS
jgi:hypothetical protein